MIGPVRPSEQVSIYLLIKLFLIGMGSVIGVLLHWLVPAINVGVGILIGVVASAMAIHFYTRLMGVLRIYDEPDVELDPEPAPPIYIYPYGPLPSRRKRKRKPS